MKLRNKKTGEVREGRVEVIFQNNDKFPNPLERHTVESFAELNEEWEEVEEPLIKDEKIRKAVRAWAEVNDEKEIRVKGNCLVTVFQGTHKRLTLELNCSWTRNGVYTIAELCGEEEQ